MTDSSILDRLAETIETRKNADPNSSYVAKLLHGGQDKILKKLAEESAETLMASKDGDAQHVVRETADLWFHCLVLLAHHDLKPSDVLDELQRREGVSGIEEKSVKENRVKMSDCLFCKIAKGEIPARKLYEDEDIFAFNDINPAAPVHFLMIPKLHIASLVDVEEVHQNLLGKMLLLAPRLAQEQGCTNGFRTIINTGHVGGQEVFHLHIHIIGGEARLPVMIHHG